MFFFFSLSSLISFLYLELFSSFITIYLHTFLSIYLSTCVVVCLCISVSLAVCLSSTLSFNQSSVHKHIGLIIQPNFCTWTYRSIYPNQSSVLEHIGLFIQPIFCTWTYPPIRLTNLLLYMNISAYLFNQSSVHEQSDLFIQPILLCTWPYLSMQWHTAAVLSLEVPKEKLTTRHFKTSFISIF